MADKEILFINYEQMDSLGVNVIDIVDILEKVFVHKAGGETLMPPKIFFHRGGSRFYSAMASCIPTMGYAGCKWQSGDPENPSRGLPYIQGLYVLSEDVTGQPLAVMDSIWITANRTAAASALVARYQARPGAEVVGMLGCGVQGRKNLDALKAVLPSVRRCQAFDIVPEHTMRYVREMTEKLDVEVVPAGSAREAVMGADVVISAGPIENQPRPVIEPGWVAPGCLGVTLDYDAYWTPAAIRSMDIVMTDDRTQIEHMQAKGRFEAVRHIDADIGEVIRDDTARRQHPGQRILSFNLGIAIEDLATAVELYQRARSDGVGSRLAL